MLKVFAAFVKKAISREEMMRYQELHKKLMGNDMFVEVGDSPEWIEFNSLNKKINLV